MGVVRRQPRRKEASHEKIKIRISLKSSKILYTMAAEAVAPTSSTTHSVTSVTSWSPMMNMNYQAALHHYMAYLHYGLPYPTSPWVTALVPPPPHPQSASSLDRTGSVSSRKRKAGTAAVPEAATAAANLPSAAVSAAGDSTRLFLRGRNGITY